MTGRAMWDPMRDDFNNSTYEEEEGNERGKLDHCKLYITNIPKVLNEDGLRAAFQRFGTLIETFLSRDPQKKYAIIRYETSSEAKLAMMKMNRTEPLKLSVSIAYKTKKNDRKETRQSEVNYEVNNRRENRHYDSYYEENNRDDNISVSSRSRNTRKDDRTNGSDVGENSLPLQDVIPSETMDPSLDLKLESLKLEQLKLREEQLMCKHRILMIQQAELAEKRQVQQSTAGNRCILPDGRIVVRNVSDRLLEARDGEPSYTATGAGDSTENTVYTRKTKTKRSWQCCETNDSPTTSTCTLCSEDQAGLKDKSELTSQVCKAYSSKIVDSNVTTTRKYVGETLSKRSDVTSKKVDAKRDGSEGACELKFSDFNTDPDDEDETNRLIQLRNADYSDIVDDHLKVVIALADYPKSKMRLQQMQLFQKCLTDIIEMQLQNGLLKKLPTFLDYYLNRGAIVCICKDDSTRDWVVRISPGLQERMTDNLVLLKADVKRLCMAVLKIPRESRPATAQAAFKLLQYFNPTLNTNLWKIYAQKVVDDVECTYILIDRVSGEIIRGSMFQNVIDYDQMEFELAGYTEIYYECLLSSMQEDLTSVASRVKLLEEIKSGEPTPRNLSDICKAQNVTGDDKKVGTDNGYIDSEHVATGVEEDDVLEKGDFIKEIESSLQQNILKKLKDVQYISDKDEVLVWSDETETFRSDYGIEKTEEIQCEQKNILEGNQMFTSTSDIALTDNTLVTESLDECNYLIDRDSNFYIDSNRGIAYYRRTNYLHVENELKVAITLEDYPQSKLDGTHIRRLKHLFKEYLHKDMKMQKFPNLIIPKFQDVYLSNGAVIYVCDSMETKDYLTEILSKLRNSTGLKLTFKDLRSLVRYTRVVLQLPKEHAHVESPELLRSIQSQYRGLKPDCWKYYSDVVGKQKRQFGVDPDSLEVIKHPNFNPVYEGEILTFRIVDRQKRDVSFEDTLPNKEEEEDAKSRERRDAVVRIMYIPIDPEIIKTPLTKIRSSHYSNLIDDDLKLYVGPLNYPETSIDEVLYHTIKRTFENIVCECLENGDLNDENVPKFYDMYLFDGVIFVISKDMSSRLWIEKNLSRVNEKLNLLLKSTEFRGAVGIVSMVLKTDRDDNEVFQILQKQNPRLRTKFWRKISTIKTRTKLDVVLQIDKLSAQVITSRKFSKLVDGNPVEFKLGHLKSILKPKASLEELSKAYLKKNKTRKDNKKHKVIKKDPNTNLDLRNDRVQGERDPKSLLIVCDESKTDKPDMDRLLIATGTVTPDDSDVRSVNRQANIKMKLEIPLNILPNHEDDLNIIFDLLEDKNPGLNTELWEIYCESVYPSDGKFILYLDKRSIFIIESKNFDSTIGGETLQFSF